MHGVHERLNHYYPPVKSLSKPTLASLSYEVAEGSVEACTVSMYQGYFSNLLHIANTWTCMPTFLVPRDHRSEFPFFTLRTYHCSSVIGSMFENKYEIMRIVTHTRSLSLI